MEKGFFFSFRPLVWVGAVGHHVVFAGGGGRAGRQVSGEERNGYRDTTKRTKEIMVMLVQCGVEEDSITHVGMEGKRP